MLESTRLRFDEFEEKQRQFDEFLYRAGSWDRFRRVIVKVEVDHRGINRRFVVTNRDDLSSSPFMITTPIEDSRRTSSRLLRTI